MGCGDDASVSHSANLQEFFGSPHSQNLPTTTPKALGETAQKDETDLKQPSLRQLV